MRYKIDDEYQKILEELAIKKKVGPSDILRLAIATYNKIQKYSLPNEQLTITVNGILDTPVVRIEVP